jgi:hypothetical protein
MSSKSAKKAGEASEKASKDANKLQKYMYDTSRADQEPWRQAGGNALSRLMTGLGLGSSSAPDRQSIMNELRGNYTTNASSQASPSGRNEPMKGSPEWMQRWAWENENPHVTWDGLREYNQPQGQSGIDYAGLNSAVDEEYKRRMAAYEAGKNDPFSGSLMKKFSLQDYVADPGYQFRLSEGMKGLDRSAAARGGLQSGSALKAAANYSQNAASQEYGNAYNRYNTDQGNQYNRLANVAGFGQTANNANAMTGMNYANQVGGNIWNNAANQGNAALAQGNARGNAWSGLGQATYGMKWPSFGNMELSDPSYYADR